MYYSYVEIDYVATSFSPARTDLALKLLICYQLFCTLLAAADGNGRRFGRHCHRWTSQIREHAEVNRN
jgi:hypothetical protein